MLPLPAFHAVSLDFFHVLAPERELLYADEFA